MLGISAFYHDSAAALVRDGDIVAAAQEERFTRQKHDQGFPGRAVAYCLDEAGITLDQVDYVCFYDKPLLTFNRLLETYLAYAPRGLPSFIKAIPVWVKEKIFQKGLLHKELNRLDRGNIKESQILFNFHHHSHAASAFYPSPFDEAAVLVMDGVGEWATTTIGVGKGTELTLLEEIRFPHSLGMLYSAFTYYLGFKVNDGEYKVMGLAPYGEPKYVQQITDHLIDVKEDGSFRLDMSYFNYGTGLTMTNARFHDLFGRPPRQTADPLTQMDMDLARSVQVVVEEIILKLVKSLHERTGQQNLVMCGGVALNCVANGRILRESPFDNMWIQPASGDAGGALGAALSVVHCMSNAPRPALGGGERDRMKGAYLGPSFERREIQAALDGYAAVYEDLPDDALFDRVADLLAQEKVVGWFQGRMEFGPRALGCRSIIGDPRSSAMQKILNLKIKYRESFRPFAPAVLRERVGDYFDHQGDSPYMLLVDQVKRDLWRDLSPEDEAKQGLDKLGVIRSDLPAITHVDHSARIQTVHEDTNPRFHRLLKTFEDKTGCGVLVNTSFNVRDEPIVCTPSDAYRCFMATEMDALVVGNALLLKERQ
ncbi:carbamoyltransferase family protein [Magnetospira thiophila]